ncbi:pro-resilin [Papilio machaon]|uniref:pro-resilin n=1 Tax=Papilio machaon TaxID=76193 RepID=UPI001E6657F9|nr:pro-resilin [Papilio machaon]
MIIVLLCLVSWVAGEPPIGDGYHAHRQYLPPDFSEARSKSFNEANEISHEYGPPSFRGISQQYGTTFNRSPSSLYGTPNTRNSPKEYNAAAEFSQEYSRSGVSQTYGEPRHSHLETYNAPQRSYSIPESSRHPVQKYGLPRFGNQSPVNHGSHYQSPMIASLRNTVSQTYGAPKSLSTEYGAPGIAARDSYSEGLSRSLSSVYGAPTARSPSGEYGTPEARSIEKTNTIASSYAVRSSQDGYEATPSDTSGGYSYSRSALEELLNQEPANYEFGYKVSDYSSGSDFGHVETRQAERAEGSYFVVLPDGTKQIVEYEADERGFKPRISVEAAETGPY